MVLTWKAQDIVILSFSIPSVVLHTVGLIILFGVQKGHGNQISAMISLAVSELIFSFVASAYSLCKISGIQNEILFNYFAGIDAFSTVANKLGVIYLVIERLLEVYFHMKYPLMFSHKTACFILTGIWVISGLNGLALGIFRGYGNAKNLLYTIYNFVFVALDLVFLCAVVMTYSYFLIKVRNIRRIDVSYKMQVRKQKHSIKILSIRRSKFIIPLLIAVTYILFNVSSTVLYQVWRYGQDPNSLQPSDVFFAARLNSMIGYICDSVFHIFMHKEVRTCILSACTIKRSNSIRSQDAKRKHATNG